MSIIAKYNNIVCEIATIKLGARFQVKFIDFFEGGDEAFIGKYKFRYPNHSFQIFRHIRKPLSKMAREAIESSTEIKSKLRDYNLDKLLS